MVLRCLWVSLAVLVCLAGFGRADESLALYLRSSISVVQDTTAFPGLQNTSKASSMENLYHTVTFLPLLQFKEKTGEFTNGQVSGRDDR